MHLTSITIYKKIVNHSFIGIFISFVLSDLNCYAFTLHPSRLKFSTNEVLIHVSGNSCTNAGLTPNRVMEIALASVERYWNQVSTADFYLKQGSVRSSVDLSADGLQEAAAKTLPNSILIGCSSNGSLFSSSSTLAVGSIGSSSAGVIGLILINDNLYGGENPFSGLDELEKEATLAHEMGHAFGLGHSGDPVALMYYSVGRKTQQRLTQDDWDALTYLYPYDNPPGGCGTIRENNSSHQWPTIALLGFLLAILLPKFHRGI